MPYKLYPARMAFYVYILTDDRNSRFIIGFTNNLVKTIHEMKFMQSGIFASQQVKKLVYFERHEEYEIAKRREREVINWEDGYMKTIISLQNAKYADLYEVIF
jgi:putative endonuclease